LTESVKSFCLRNAGKGIVVLITDLMDKNGYEAALRALVAQDLDIYVIQVLSQAEIDPDLKGDLKLVDVEDQDFAEISISPRLLDKYRRTLASFIETAREFSARRGISYMMTSTDRPVDRLISRYLRQRGLVR
jgi:indole-3-glycerol phosphate synthase